MKTLVYFASGPIREEYQNLDFDKIYLIDKCFRSRSRNQSNGFSRGRVTCIGMDCLESIEFLRNEQIQIDYFVSLNEGLYEGGGSYAINSDMFLGYAMQLFKDKYVHIMNKDYYLNNMYNVSMDLPYSIEEIKDNDERYLNPLIFSKIGYHAKVFQMTRYLASRTEININPKIKVQIIHDSIWNFYKELDVSVLSFSNQGQGDFFSRKFNIIDLNETDIGGVFDFCKKNKIKKIGFTPFGRGFCKLFLKTLEEFKEDYPREVVLFHLNKDDYREVKNYISKTR